MDRREKTGNPLFRMSVAEIFEEVIALEQSDAIRKHLAALNNLLQDLDAQNRRNGRPTQHGMHGRNLKKHFEKKKEIAMKDNMICVCWVLSSINIQEIHSFEEATASCVVIKNGDVYIPVVDRENTFHGEFRKKNNPRTGYVQRINEIVDKYGYGLHDHIISDERHLPAFKPEEKASFAVRLPKQPWADGLCLLKGRVTEDDKVSLAARGREEDRGWININIVFQRSEALKIAELLDHGNLNSASINGSAEFTVRLGHDPDIKGQGMIKVDSGFRDGHGDFNGRYELSIHGGRDVYVSLSVHSMQRKALQTLLLKDGPTEEIDLS